MKNSSRVNDLLAGVCSRLSKMFHFNVWVLRAIFIILLLAKTFVTILAYAALALIFHWVERLPKSAGSSPQEPALGSSELASRNRRIEQLDRRFRDWENSLSR